MASKTDWTGTGCGRFAVTVIPNYMLTLSDNTKISLKIWYPSNKLDEIPFRDSEHYLEWDPTERGQTSHDSVSPMEKPVPVILEYLPYRHSDYTLPNDFVYHTWMCSHGYVGVRADMRGTGCSQGLYHGEYLEQEQRDCLEIIEWLAVQSWCDGSVGMSGHSWGGFNGLQLAFLKPPALKAVITTYSTDDRYASDIHSLGGAFIGADSLAWSAHMFTGNLQPPNPCFIKDWHSEWEKRLNSASSPWIRDWLQHQTRDEFWKHGSSIEDKSRIQIPVLAFGRSVVDPPKYFQTMLSVFTGGFQDGYRDTVFRLAEYMPNFRGIVGPWSHKLPYQPFPGPAINYNAECLKWWDHHLKGIQNDVMLVPRLRLYLQEGLPPQGSYSSRPGYWVTEPVWPPSPDQKNRYLTLALDNSEMSLVESKADNNFVIPDCSKVVDYDGRSGLAGKKWYTYGASDELPGDQRNVDKYGLSLYSEELDQDVAILGQPTLHCTVAVENSDTGVLIARLCDVFPDGRSTLLSHGVLNLNHYKGHGPDEATPLEPKKEYKVKVNFMATSCIVKKGHKLSLGISSCYYPLIWPSKDPVQLKIRTGPCPDASGALTSLVLPVRPLDLPSDGVSFEKVPKYPLPIDIQKEGFRRKNITEAVEPQKKHVFQIEENNGTQIIKPTNTVMNGRHTIDQYEINTSDPLSAKALVTDTLSLHWPDGDGSGEPIKVDLSTTSEMWADKSNFYTKHNAEVKLNDESIFERSWDDTFPRHFW